MPQDPGIEDDHGLLLGALRRVVHVPAGETFEVLGVEDLSPGMTATPVRRVRFITTSTADRGRREHSLVVKSDGEAARTGAVRVESGTRSAVRRESDVYRALQHLTLPVRVPRLLGASRDQGRGPHRLWLEDVAVALRPRWTLTDAGTAIEAAAALHLLDLGPDPAEAAVLRERVDEFAAYADHVPAARDNLTALDDHPTMVLPAQLVESMRCCLDRCEDFLKALGGQPRALQHGDLHPGNAGFDVDGRLVLFDWAHAGQGLLGADIAIFLSGYAAFGGDREHLSSQEFDEWVWARYADALTAGGAAGSRVLQVHHTALWWACTWGIHARLGPGLGAVLNGVLPARAVPAVCADILDGCQRAERALRELDHRG